MANSFFSVFSDNAKEQNAEARDEDANNFFSEFDRFLDDEIGSSPSPVISANTNNFSLTSLDDASTSASNTTTPNGGRHDLHQQQNGTHHDRHQQINDDTVKIKCSTATSYHHHHHQ